MKVKDLITTLLDGKLEDEVKIYEPTTDTIYKINFIDMMPSHRDKGVIYIEFIERDSR